MRSEVQVLPGPPGSDPFPRSRSQKCRPLVWECHRRSSSLTFPVTRSRDLSGASKDFFHIAVSASRSFWRIAAARAGDTADPCCGCGRAARVHRVPVRSMCTDASPPAVLAHKCAPRDRYRRGRVGWRRAQGRTLVGEAAYGADQEPAVLQRRSGQFRCERQNLPGRFPSDLIVVLVRQRDGRVTSRSPGAGLRCRHEVGTSVTACARRVVPARQDDRAQPDPAEQHGHVPAPGGMCDAAFGLSRRQDVTRASALT